MIRREVSHLLNKPGLSRVEVLTGARQTGKTTLARAAFADRPYLSMDDPVLRAEVLALSAEDWRRRFPRVVVDEVQKAPLLFDVIKAVHDAEPTSHFVLLGSSQVLLLDRVRESLAGRAHLQELWPLTLPEIVGAADPVVPSRLVGWLRKGAPSHDELAQGAGLLAADPAFARAREAFERFMRIGGMPLLWAQTPADADALTWLHDYRKTYLERDVRDLAAIRDLELFTRAQAVAALRTAQTLNFSDLARSASISPATAQKFVRYLEMSYQVLLVPPFFRNLEKRLVRQPKIHFLDAGVWRAVAGVHGGMTGALFETVVVAEIHKQIANARVPARLHHLRTQDGREVDLLIELEQGFVAIEIKLTNNATNNDARHLRALDSILDKKLLAALVISNDPRLQLLDGALAVPAPWVLGPPV